MILGEVQARQRSLSCCGSFLLPRILNSVAAPAVQIRIRRDNDTDKACVLEVLRHVLLAELSCFFAGHQLWQNNQARLNNTLFVYGIHPMASIPSIGCCASARPARSRSMCCIVWRLAVPRRQPWPLPRGSHSTRSSTEACRPSRRCTRCIADLGHGLRRLLRLPFRRAIGIMYASHKNRMMQIVS
jgi:hypothetical protein